MFDSLVAVYPTHLQAELAIRKLADNHFDMKHLSIVGRGYHTEEQVTGFYNTGDRVQFWGTRGAFWGGMWGLFFGGMFLTVPVIGQVMVLGYLASVVVATIEGAVVVGGHGVGHQLPPSKRNGKPGDCHHKRERRQRPHQRIEARSVGHQQCLRAELILNVLNDLIVAWRALLDEALDLLTDATSR